MRYLIGYFATGVAFLALDFVWLSIMMPRLYKPMLEPILAPGLSAGPAIAFYLIYVGATLILAVLPATTWTHAAGLGFVFGFGAYATYNLTNQATLKVWPLPVVVADMAWGGIATAAAAFVAYHVLRLTTQS